MALQETVATQAKTNRRANLDALAFVRSLEGELNELSIKSALGWLKENPDHLLVSWVIEKLASTRDESLETKLRNWIAEAGEVRGILALLEHYPGAASTILAQGFVRAHLDDGDVDLEDIVSVLARAEHISDGELIVEWICRYPFNANSLDITQRLLRQSKRYQTEAYLHDRLSRGADIGGLLICLSRLNAGGGVVVRVAKSLISRYPHHHGIPSLLCELLVAGKLRNPGKTIDRWHRDQPAHPLFVHVLEVYRTRRRRPKHSLRLFREYAWSDKPGHILAQCYLAQENRTGEVRRWLYENIDKYGDRNSWSILYTLLRHGSSDQRLIEISRRWISKTDVDGADKGSILQMLFWIRANLRQDPVLIQMVRNQTIQHPEDSSLLALTVLSSAPDLIPYVKHHLTECEGWCEEFPYAAMEILSIVRDEELEADLRLWLELFHRLNRWDRQQKKDLAHGALVYFLNKGQDHDIKALAQQWLEDFGCSNNREATALRALLA